MSQTIFGHFFFGNLYISASQVYYNNYRYHYRYRHRFRQKPLAHAYAMRRARRAV